MNIGTWTPTSDTALVTNAVAVYGETSNIGIQQRHTAKINKTTVTLSLGT